jgi:hypothetical protein
MRRFKLRIIHTSVSTSGGVFVLYRFSQKNMGDVIMLEPNGRQMLESSARCLARIILPADAIKALEAAIKLEEW